VADGLQGVGFGESWAVEWRCFSTNLLRGASHRTVSWGVRPRFREGRKCL